MTYNTTNTRDTELVGRALADKLLSEGRERAFIALRGEMGVGKTAFVRGFCSALEISGVRSPTYTIVNEYRGKMPVFHFDLYRIDDSGDLESIGFEDYLKARGFCIAEWSERIEDDIPSDAIYVSISRTSDGEDNRAIEICGIEL